MEVTNMSRKPRLFCDSGFYHVILRGNNRQNLFNDDSDRMFFINRLRKYSIELGISIHAYCLMNNHVHILIGNADRNMSLLMQKLANSYVFYFNRKYERSGHLFQGRFKSEPIMDDAYFKTVYRYILQNCEKAGLGTVEHYKWNSYIALKFDRVDFVENAYILGLFDSKQQLLDFISHKEIVSCMEYENRILFSDEKAFRLIKKLFRISTPYSLERLPVMEQVRKCKVMKEKGISKRQIVRITGISQSILKCL